MGQKTAPAVEVRHCRRRVQTYMFNCRSCAAPILHILNTNDDQIRILRHGRYSFLSVGVAVLIVVCGRVVNILTQNHDALCAVPAFQCLNFPLYGTHGLT